MHVPSGRSKIALVDSTEVKQVAQDKLEEQLKQLRSLLRPDPDKRDVNDLTVSANRVDDERHVRVVIGQLSDNSQPPPWSSK
jgi:hypothetical protein